MYSTCIFCQKSLGTNEVIESFPNVGSFSGVRRPNCRTSFPETKLPLQQLIPSLGVADIERSVDFYREYLGFDIAHSHDERGSLVWCHMKSGGADLMLQ